jgi:hypothetical protein
LMHKIGKCRDVRDEMATTHVFSYFVILGWSLHFTFKSQTCFDRRRRRWSKFQIGRSLLI